MNSNLIGLGQLRWGWRSTDPFPRDLSYIFLHFALHNKVLGIDVPGVISEVVFLGIYPC